MNTEITINVRRDGRRQTTIGRNRDARTKTPIHQNVGGIERLFSTLAGGRLMLLGLRQVLRKRPRLGLLVGALGGMFAHRGITGRCRAYAALGVSDNPGVFSHPLDRRITLRESVTIRRPVGEVYEFWRNFENLADAVERLERVEILDEHRSLWVWRGPGGLRLEWEATVTEDRPNERISWMACSETAPFEGTVTFQPGASEGESIVRLTVSYRPHRGIVGAIAGRIGSGGLAALLRSELRQVKGFLESHPAQMASMSIPDTAKGPTEHPSEQPKGSKDPVTEASEESFPASDAPSWSATRT